MSMEIQRLIASIYEASSLRKIQRSHQQTLLTSDPSDTIASHVSLVAHIGVLLAQLAGVDAGKVAIMCIFHDDTETRTGDQSWVHKKHIESNEEAIRTAQLELPGMGSEILDLMKEYDERETLTAKVAKDADTLAQWILLHEYAHAGNKEAQRWIDTDKDKKERLYTEEGRRLFQEIPQQRPSSWWDDLWAATRRKINS